jgi:hypothetical protein
MVKVHDREDVANHSGPALANWDTQEIERQISLNAN